VGEKNERKGLTGRNPKVRPQRPHGAPAASPTFFDALVRSE